MTTLQSIAANVQLANDHDHFDSIEVHFDILTGRADSIKIGQHTPALLTNHGEHNADLVLASALKLIRGLKATEISKDPKQLEYSDVVMLAANKAANSIAAKSYRGAGNQVFVSLEMYDLVKNNRWFNSATMSWHIEEQLTNDEMIVVYNNPNLSMVDAGLVVANFPNGYSMLCELPHWDHYYEYVKFI
jgi:hypothetical protein